MITKIALAIKGRSEFYEIFKTACSYIHLRNVLVMIEMGSKWDGFPLKNC